MGLVEDVDVAVMTLEAVAERYPVGADRVAAYAAAQRRLSAVSMVRDLVRLKRTQQPNVKPKKNRSVQLRTLSMNTCSIGCF